jgi:hypothetical protein
MQVHPYQKKQAKQPESLVKALHGPKVPPHATRASLLQLCKCPRCRKRPENTLPDARTKLAKTKEVYAELGALVRRISFQLKTPGGVHELKECIDDLLYIEMDTSSSVPKLSDQAVSPRFLRRLCKLYTSYDIVVDHQIPTMHCRPDIDRSPFFGEMYAGDRFRCDLDLSGPL